MPPLILDVSVSGSPYEAEARQLLEDVRLRLQGTICEGPVIAVYACEPMNRVCIVLAGVAYYRGVRPGVILAARDDGRREVGEVIAGEPIQWRSWTRQRASLN